MSAPTVGRVLHYELTEHDAAAINKRRDDAASNRVAIAKDALGYVAHTGNKAEAGQVFPLTVTRVWGPGCVNGQLLLDGNDTLWKTSVTEANDTQSQGRWSWPPRV